MPSNLGLYVWSLASPGLGRGLWKLMGEAEQAETPRRQERHLFRTQHYWWGLGRSNRSWINFGWSFIKRPWFICSNILPSLSLALPCLPSPTNIPTHNRTSLLKSSNSNNSGLKKKALVKTQTSLTISQDSKEKKRRGPGKVNAFVFI